MIEQALISIMYQRKKKKVDKGKHVIETEEPIKEITRKTKLERMDAKINKKIKRNWFLTPEELRRYNELVELAAQIAQGIQSS